jgi:hypothetical protein
VPCAIIGLARASRPTPAIISLFFMVCFAPYDVAVQEVVRHRILGDRALTLPALNDA